MTVCEKDNLSVEELKSRIEIWVKKVKESGGDITDVESACDHFKSLGITAGVHTNKLNHNDFSEKEQRRSLEWYAGYLMIIWGQNRKKVSFPILVQTWLNLWDDVDTKLYGE